MKNYIFFKCFYILAGLVLIFNVFFDLGDSLFYNTEDLPIGEKQTEFVSPQKDKKIEAYIVKNSLGVAIRARYISISDNTSKNIYWQTDTDVIQVEWLNNSIVNINGVRLNVDGDYVYDSRKGSSIFREGSFEGIAETMYLEN